MENWQRRKKIAPTEEEHELLDRTFYDRETRMGGYGNHPLAVVMRTDATIAQRRTAIYDFAKEHDLNPYTVIHDALERTSGSGWGSSSKGYPHWVEARIHLQKMLPPDHWTADDGQGLKVLAEGLKAEKISWHLGETNRDQRKRLIASLEAMAKTVEKTTQPKGGKPPAEVKEKLDRFKMLQDEMEKMRAEHARQLAAAGEQRDRTYKQLTETQQAKRKAEEAAKNAREDSQRHERAKTAAEEEATRLRQRAQEALSHVDAAHKLVKAVMMPATVRKIRTALDNARKRLG